LAIPQIKKVCLASIDYTEVRLNPPNPHPRIRLQWTRHDYGVYWYP